MKHVKVNALAKTTEDVIIDTVEFEAILDVDHVVWDDVRERTQVVFRPLLNEVEAPWRRK